jgi:hypothetical protein
MIVSLGGDSDGCPNAFYPLLRSFIIATRAFTSEVANMDSKAGPSRFRAQAAPSRSSSSHSGSESSYYHTDEDEDDLREDTTMSNRADAARNYQEAGTKGKGKTPLKVEPTSPAHSPTDTVSERSTSRRTSRSWTDLNMSIAIALLSPIGNWLTGSDHVKHLCLLLLLIYYLHQLIEGKFTFMIQSVS